MYLFRDTLGNCYFLLAEIALKGATYHISFSDTDQLPAPFRIDNMSEVSDYFFRPRLAASLNMSSAICLT